MNASDSTDNSVCLAPFRYSTIGVICQTELENILNSSNCPSDAENVFVVRNEEVRATQLIAELTGIGASLECRRKIVSLYACNCLGCVVGQESSSSHLATSVKILETHSTNGNAVILAQYLTRTSLNVQCYLSKHHPVQRNIMVIL